MKYTLFLLASLISYFSFANGFLGPDTTICPSCYTLTAPVGSNYIWSTGGNTQSIEVCTDTTVTIWMSYNNNDGETITLEKDTITINVKGIYPDTVGYSLNKYIGGCWGDCKFITGPGDGHLYSWSPSLGLNDSTMQNPVVCLINGSMQYHVTVFTDTALECKYIFPVTLNVADLPEIIETDYVICKDSCTVLQAPDNGQKFIWTPDINIDDFSAKNPLVCPEKNMEYILSTETDTVFHCSYKDTVSIVVSDTCINSTSVRTNSLLEKITIFPNPVHDQININAPNNLGDMQIRIINGLGKVVITTYDKVIDIENLEKGIYFIEMNYNFEKYFEKVVLQ